MYDLRILGRNIKRYRQFRGLTQEDLAAKAGVTKDTISRLEVAKARRLGLEHLVLICEILDVKLEILFAKDPKVKY